MASGAATNQLRRDVRLSVSLHLRQSVWRGRKEKRKSKQIKTKTSSVPPYRYYRADEKW